MFPLWLVERGEAVSFILVVAVLLLGARVIARAVGVPARVADDQFFWGALAFIVAGRLAEVALGNPTLLLDPMVVIRFTDGVEPIAGAAGVLGWLAFRARREDTSTTPGDDAGGRWLVAIVGLILASAVYGLACPLREACFGATAPAPLGIPLHGLVEPRLPTPLLESIVLLLVLAQAARLMDRWPRWRLGWTLLAILALVRLALTPLSAGGVHLPTMAVLGIVAVASAVLAWRLGGRGAVPPEPAPSGLRSAPPD